jgi:hypothetical protein
MYAPIQVGHWHSAIFWAVDSGISQMPPIIHQQGYQSCHHWSLLDPLMNPQLTWEETISWPASHAGQTCFLLDGQAVHPHREASFNFTLLGPSRANSYIPMTAGTNILTCGAFSWIDDSKKSASTLCHSLTGTADPSPTTTTGPSWTCYQIPADVSVPQRIASSNGLLGC